MDTTLHETHNGYYSPEITVSLKFFSQKFCAKINLIIYIHYYCYLAWIIHHISGHTHGATVLQGISLNLQQLLKAEEL